MYMVMIYQVIKQENVGHHQLIQVEIIQLLKENLKDNYYSMNQDCHRPLVTSIRLVNNSLTSY